VLLERLHLVMREAVSASSTAGAAAPTQAQPLQQHHPLMSRQQLDTSCSRPASPSLQPQATNNAMQNRHGSNSRDRSLTGAARGAGKKQLLVPSINGARDSSATAMSEQNLLVELDAMFW